MRNRFTNFRRGLTLAVLFAIGSLAARAQSVGVGTTTPAASAALDVTSTTGGMLLPRMTATKRAAIPNPVQGLFVFQTDGTPGLYYYVGNSWVNVVNGLVPDVDGNAGANPAILVSTLAGSGTAGYVNDRGTAAQFFNPTGVTVDGSGAVYVADKQNHLIRKITAMGEVTTLAGPDIRTVNFGGGGGPGYVDGPSSVARFNNPIGVAVDRNGIVYVADAGNHCIRIVTAMGMVSTLAGSGTAGNADGMGTAAQFNVPMGVALGGSGAVYVADTGNHCIRTITTAGMVSTLAGSGTAGFANGTGPVARFDTPTGVVVYSGRIYVADQGNCCIRKIMLPGGEVSTLAGSGSPSNAFHMPNTGLTAGYADGTGAAAQFNYPSGVAVDTYENVYVADTGNNNIRKITPMGVVSTLAGRGTAGFANGTGPVAQFNGPAGVAVYAPRAGTVYVADTNNNRIQVIK